MPDSPFYHYHTTFDAEAVIRAHAVPDLKPNPSYLTNYLGVLIDPKFFPDIAGLYPGHIETVPIPANWHADIAEWAAALRAVDLSSGRFTVMELGCGWGCWLNNTGVAARRAGRAPHLIGVEAEPGHLQFARDACRVNGFADSEVTLLHGVAACQRGVALFPRLARTGTHWGLSPALDAGLAARARARLTGDADEVPMMPLGEAAGTHRRIDLLHIDIQGGEAELIENSRAVLDARFAYLVIGTHSREIEGRLFAALRSAGWFLEIERPAILSLDGGAPTVTVDGVQGWRNPRLLPM